MNFCLGLSLIFSNIFPSPVPYSSLIFQANLDRRLTGKCIQSPPRLSNVLKMAPICEERFHGIQIGAAKHILLCVLPSRLPLAQILLQQLQDPNVHCLLTFSKRLDPVSQCWSRSGKFKITFWDIFLSYPYLVLIINVLLHLLQ